MNIGIIGLGVVGNTLKQWYDNNFIKPYCYDKFKKIGSIEEVNEADIVFICVPTPQATVACDLKEVVECVKNLIGSKIVVIKSTISPGTTNSLQKRYQLHKFIFNPEFLNAENPYKRLINPDVQILGVTEQSNHNDITSPVFDLLPYSKNSIVMSSIEAEILKYMENSYLAMKVVFANEFFDLCKKVGCNYDEVKKVGLDSRIGTSHLEIFKDGYRGFAGHCLPKDVNSIIEFANQNNIDMSLMKKVVEINNKLRKQDS